MKIKFLSAVSCMIGSFAKDQVAEVETVVAASWIKSGLAVSAEPAVAPVAVVVEEVQSPVALTPAEAPKAPARSGRRGK